MTLVNQIVETLQSELLQNKIISPRISNVSTRAEVFESSFHSQHSNACGRVNGGLPLKYLHLK